MLNNFEYCECECHDPNSLMQVRHIIPCCTTCSVCKQHIKNYYTSKHEEQCWDKLEAILNKK